MKHKPNAQKYEVDVKKVEKLASYGNTYEEISDILSVPSETLRKSYSQFYTKGKENLKERLRKKQINVALKGNVVMLIWLGKQYLTQSDKVDQKFYIPDGYEITIGKKKKAED